MMASRTRRALSVAVLAWWFLMTSRTYQDFYVTVPVGPFVSKVECEALRAWNATGQRMGWTQISECRELPR